MGQDEFIEAFTQRLLGAYGKTVRSSVSWTLAISGSNNSKPESMNRLSGKSLYENIAPVNIQK